MDDAADLIPVKRFSNRPSAELARAVLETDGIRAVVVADDSGGMVPIPGARLLVARADAERAQQLLATAEPGRPSSPTRVAARPFLLMFLGIAALLGSFVAASEGSPRWVRSGLFALGLLLLTIGFVQARRT